MVEQKNKKTLKEELCLLKTHKELQILKYKVALKVLLSLHSHSLTLNHSASHTHKVHWGHSICNTDCQSTSKITSKLWQCPLTQDTSCLPVLVFALSPFFWCKGWRSSCQTCQPLMIWALLSVLPFLKEPRRPAVNNICLAYHILFLLSTFSPEYWKSVNEKLKAILGH